MSRQRTSEGQKQLWPDVEKEGMPLKVSCWCGAEGWAPASQPGDTLRCLKCGAIFTVPGLECARCGTKLKSHRALSVSGIRVLSYCQACVREIEEEADPHEFNFLCYRCGSSIELYIELDHACYCPGCGEDITQDIELEKQKGEWSELRWMARLRNAARKVKFATLLNLQGDIDEHYQGALMVDADFVIGKGDWNDLLTEVNGRFVPSSGAIAEKLKTAKKWCRTALKMKAAAQGANVVHDVETDWLSCSDDRIAITMRGFLLRVVPSSSDGSTQDAARPQQGGARANRAAGDPIAPGSPCPQSGGVRSEGESEDDALNEALCPPPIIV